MPLFRSRITSRGSVGACRFPGERCRYCAVQARQDRQQRGSRCRHRPPELAAARQAAPRSAAGGELAVAAYPGWAAEPAPPGGIGAGPGGSGPGDAGPGGSGPGGGPLAVGGVPRAALRSPLKNWRVRSRLLLLVLLPTLAAVILGGVQRAVLGAQRRWPTSGWSSSPGWAAGSPTWSRRCRPNARTPSGTSRWARRAAAAAAPGGAAAPRAGRARPGSPQPPTRSRPGCAAWPAASARPTRRWPSRRPRERSPRSTGSRRCAASRPAPQIPSLAVIQEYAATINQLLALEDEIATGSNDAALADTVRVVGLISATKEEVSQEQAILTSALTPDLVGATQLGPGQLTAINAAQAEQQRRPGPVRPHRHRRAAPAVQQRAVLGPGRPGPGAGAAGHHAGRSAAARRRRTRPSPTPPTGPPTWSPACTRSSRG